MNNNTVNLITAIVLSVLIIFGWQYFYEKPRLEKLAAQQRTYQQQMAEAKQNSTIGIETNVLTRDEVVSSNARVKISSSSLSGSISLKGLRFDDLILNGYKQNLESDSKDVALFSPADTNEPYFVEFGWLGANSKQNEENDLPSSETLWQADTDVLTTEKPVTFSWTNKHGVEFKVIVEVDENYLFTVTQEIHNKSTKATSFQSYGLVNRRLIEQPDKMLNIVHQGPIGVISDKLEEHTYSTVKDKKHEGFTKAAVEWVGITDKYWLTTFIPDKSLRYNTNFNYAIKNGSDRYQVDFLSDIVVVEVGGVSKIKHRLFAGAKKVDLLDKYEQSLNIKLFDRAIDFGWFYVLTKPIFNAMNFFYSYFGNFGISIMIVTVIIKLLMFTLANKSYRSMKKMKKLQPQMDRLKELYSDDKARLNQEVMDLYKKEKVNPLSGCLPLVVQIPVFFSIYKVLGVTIEMRHAPFFGWVQDLSAADPTTIFNLFGLLHFTPPSFLMIGAWPIIMAVTMWLQQRMSPEPADPVQAQVVKLMPIMFLFMFSSFPVGLLIYWSWNNLLSILQQYYIIKLDND